MTDTKDFNPSKVPTDYPLCLHRQCPLASTCLRQLVEQHCNDTAVYWYIISPKRIAALQGECPGSPDKPWGLMWKSLIFAPWKIKV